MISAWAEAAVSRCFPLSLAHVPCPLEPCVMTWVWGCSSKNLVTLKKPRKANPSLLNPINPDTWFWHDLVSGTLSSIVPRMDIAIITLDAGLWSLVILRVPRGFISHLWILNLYQIHSEVEIFSVFRKSVWFMSYLNNAYQWALFKQEVIKSVL